MTRTTTERGAALFTVACAFVACSDKSHSAATALSASVSAPVTSASAPLASASVVLPAPHAAPRLLPPLDVQHLRAWAREADGRIPDDGLLTSPPPRAETVWVSWPLPIASLPPRVYSVITCRPLAGPQEDAAHIRGTCRLWTVDFGTHEWAAAPLDLPSHPRDLGDLRPVEADADREIALLLSDAGTAFLDTLAGWPPASRGWDSVRGNAHRLGELLGRTLTPEMMRLYWEADARFFRWVEISAELDVMGRGGRFRPCAKRAPETFDRDGLAAAPIAESVPTRRDGCLRLTRPLMNEATGVAQPSWILPPRFVVDVDPESLAATGVTPGESWIKPLPQPSSIEKHDSPELAAKIRNELPHVVGLFLRREPLSSDESDAIVGYEADLFALVGRGLEPTYRSIAPDFFRWLDEVRSGGHTRL